MKAKVIIENGQTTIIVTPENDFEKDVIEKLHAKSNNYDIRTNAYAEYNYGTYSKHQIEINIKEQKK